jgi:hypothetical protein
VAQPVKKNKKIKIKIFFIYLIANSSPFINACIRIFDLFLNAFTCSDWWYSWGLNWRNTRWSNATNANARKRYI